MVGWSGFEVAEPAKPFVGRGGHTVDPRRERQAPLDTLRATFAKPKAIQSEFVSRMRNQKPFGAGLAPFDKLKAFIGDFQLAVRHLSNGMSPGRIPHSKSGPPSSRSTGSRPFAKLA